jgi:hypothetical protein
MPEPLTDLSSFSFVLAVPDINSSASYFRDSLGFRLEWPEGTGWQLATRGNVRIMIGHCPDASPPRLPETIAILAISRWRTPMHFTKS